MSIGARVYSRENGQTYELKELLGSGAIGSVYLGVGTGSEIAVKIPHARLPADLEQRFWQELVVLNKLWDASGGRFFPRAWRGSLAETGREVLCMELVRGARLVKLAEHDGGVLEEKLTLDAGLQYAQMLEVLHGADISCPDRKADDLFWDANTQQLTVLDWNVVKLGRDNMDPAQDLYIFGSLWYQLITGSLPSPVADRIRGPLEDHPNWARASYGLQSILRKALSPAPQWRYHSSRELREAIQKHRDDFNHPPADLLRDAERWLQQAQAPYGAGMEALYKAEGARFYNEKEAEQSLQHSIARIKELQKSRDEALRLADLARRRQVGGAEAVWIEAQNLHDGLVELVDNGSRRVRMVQYTAALQWLKVAEEAVAEDRSELLKLRRWQALADAGQAAMARDMSLKLSLDPLAEIVEALEHGEVSTAASQWARLSPKLESAGWKESELAGRFLWSLAHEATVWQAWDLAHRHEEAGQYGEAAQQLDRAVLEADKVTYADRLLAVLGHTSKSLADAARELHGRARIEQSAHRLLQEGTGLLNQGDFVGAIESLRDGLALVAGKPETQRLREQLEHGLRVARWMPKLDGVILALPESDAELDVRTRDWHAAIDVLEKLAKDEALEPIVCQRVRSVLEEAYRELDRIRKMPADAPAPESSGRMSFSLGGDRKPPRAEWSGVKSANRARAVAMLVERLRELYQGPGALWVDRIMQSTGW